VLQLFVVRFRNTRRARRQADVEEQWLPVLAESSEEIPAALPALAPRDVVPFLTMWNQLQESFAGDVKGRLNEVARRVGIDRTVRRLLDGRGLRERLLAISTLGHLADRTAWDTLVRLTGDADGMLSFAAARALTRIDPAAALPVILPRVAQRDDWSRNYVLGMLSDLGADTVSGPLTRATLEVPIARAHRLLQFFSVAHVKDAVPVVRTLIGRSPTVECLAACLRVFADVDDLDTVRSYLRHPSWQVRVQAVNVLGRLGSADDHAVLVPLLSDPEWWVRYRAARALLMLPGSDPAHIKALGERHQDAFARDMLTHVLAEAHA
jgi:hypothetical protein